MDYSVVQSALLGRNMFYTLETKGCKRINLSRYMRLNDKTCHNNEKQRVYL
jgi:hypothetical protein